MNLTLQYSMLRSYAPYQYEWRILPGGAWNTSDTIDLTGLTTNTQILARVIDSNDCSDSDTLNLTVNPELIVDAGLDQTVCAYDTAFISGAFRDRFLLIPSIGVPEI